MQIYSTMIPTLTNNRKKLSRLCGKYKVKLLEAFGSAATNDIDEKAEDLDFLVEFHPLSPGEYAESYFGLLEELEKLYGKHVDLLMRSAVKNPYLLRSIEASREPLYEG